MMMWQNAMRDDADRLNDILDQDLPVQSLDTTAANLGSTVEQVHRLGHEADDVVPRPEFVAALGARLAELAAQQQRDQQDRPADPPAPPTEANATPPQSQPQPQPLVVLPGGKTNPLKRRDRLSIISTLLVAAILGAIFYPPIVELLGRHFAFDGIGIRVNDPGSGAATMIIGQDNLSPTVIKTTSDSDGMVTLRATNQSDGPRTLEIPALGSVLTIASGQSAEQRLQIADGTYVVIIGADIPYGVAAYGTLVVGPAPAAQEVSRIPRSSVGLFPRSLYIVCPYQADATVPATPGPDAQQLPLDSSDVLVLWSSDPHKPMITWSGGLPGLGFARESTANTSVDKTKDNQSVQTCIQFPTDVRSTVDGFVIAIRPTFQATGDVVLRAEPHWDAQELLGSKPSDELSFVVSTRQLATATASGSGTFAMGSPYGVANDDGLWLLVRDGVGVVGWLALSSISSPLLDGR